MESRTNESLTATATIDQPSEIANISLSLTVVLQLRIRHLKLKKGEQQLAQMVIARLEKQDIEQISDLLYNPPETKPYQAIKERLITAFEESDKRQFQKLVSEIELGDQKPSHLLRRMRDLARERIPDATIRILWTNHLTPLIRSVLAVSDSFSTKTALEELALLADKMLEQYRKARHCRSPYSFEKKSKN
ncbi:unnamed protein product [Euphydryas editha]|uniref:DUF7041 domain-containing protein n=1 Tax=Euphydryas editha TaxID=104508 RepID=A0AAU9TAE2_EUPED|nr:unnamed protein product [Euphydryas editha]